MSRWQKWDDFILSIQHGFDRLTRRLRHINPQQQNERRFVVIQIDGLAHRRLKMALESGRMPFVRRLLQRGVVKETPFFCGLPSSTAAFQAGAFYGTIPDIPGWRYYDKREGALIHFPDPGAAAAVERREREASGRTGLLKGGTSYGNVFNGDSEISVITFSSMYEPRVGLNWASLWFFVPSIITLWVLLKILVLSAYELVYGLILMANDRLRRRKKPLTVDRVFLHIWFHAIWRQLATLGVSSDIYKGVPRIYANFVSYDVFAHKYGPSSRVAMRSLTAIDASIRQVYRAVRRVPEYNYDIYILSDHGMAESTSFDQISKEPLSGVVLGALGAHLETRPSQPEMVNSDHGDIAERLAWLRRLSTLVFFLSPKLEKYLEKLTKKLECKWLKKFYPDLDIPKMLEEIKIVPAGPNVLVYFMHKREPVLAEEIEARYPGALLRLSAQPGIGIVLARNSKGVAYYWRGEEFQVDINKAAAGCPFRNLTYRSLLMQALIDLMSMPSAGDLIIYGNGSGQGTISYLGERGSHAGLSADELFAFVIYPKNVDFAFERVTRPRDFYNFFSRYSVAEEVVTEDLRKRHTA